MREIALEALPSFVPLAEACTACTVNKSGVGRLPGLLLLGMDAGAYNRARKIQGGF
jgi:hypothetical protein